MTAYQRLMILHGLIILFIGLAGGFFLVFNILGGISLSPIPILFDYQVPGTAAQWRAVHVGNITNGLMAIIFAMLMAKLSLGEGQKKFVAYGMVVTIWGNALFYIFGIFTPNRGLSLGDNAAGEANWAAGISFLPALAGAIILMSIVVVMIRALPRD